MIRVQHTCRVLDLNSFVNLVSARVSSTLCYRAKLSMPQYLSLEAQSLLRCLFKRNPVNRLGSGPTKGNEIKSHEFFASIDFEKLFRKEIKPPYIPAPSDSHNHFYFQDKSSVKTTNTTNSSGVSSMASSQTIKGDRGKCHM